MYRGRVIYLFIRLGKKMNNGNVAGKIKFLLKKHISCMEMMREDHYLFIRLGYLFLLIKIKLRHKFRYKVIQARKVLFCLTVFQ